MGKDILSFRRRTKIVATLGPASDDPKVIEELINAGADVLRFNFSHAAPEKQKSSVEQIRALSSKLGHHIGIMGDLQGPKIRIESFKQGSVNLEQGQVFMLDTKLGSSDGDETSVGVAYSNLINDVIPGDTLLLDDGQIVLEVSEIKSSRIICKVVEGGLLTDHKGLNKKGGGLSAPALTDKDKKDIIEAANFDMDFVSVSFA